MPDGVVKNQPPWAPDAWAYGTPELDSPSAATVAEIDPRFW